MLKWHNSQFTTFTLLRNQTIQWLFYIFLRRSVKETRKCRFYEGELIPPHTLIWLTVQETRLILFVFNTFLNHAPIFYTMLYYCTTFTCGRFMLLLIKSLTYRSKFVHFSAIFSQSFVACLEGNSLKLWTMTAENANIWQLNSYQRILKAFLDSRNNWLRFFRTSDPSAINRHRVSTQVSITARRSNLDVGNWVMSQMD